MQRYRSIFTESNNDMVKSEQEGKQIVDISNLEWGEILFESDWNTAESKCASGWRLPTVQELYTAMSQGVLGFKRQAYWSSSTYTQNTNGAWLVSFLNGVVSYRNKSNVYYVRCVKEI